MRSASSTAEADVAHVGLVSGDGGDALLMLQLAKATQDTGARARVMVPSTPETAKFEQRCQLNGVQCDRTPHLNAIMQGARVGLLPALSLLRSIQAPIVHFHSYLSILPRGVMLSLEALRYRRCIVTLHDPYVTLTPGSLKATFWATFARRRFAAVVSPSVHAASLQRACGIPSSLAVTVPNAVDTVAVAHGDGSVPRATLGMGPNDPLVVFLARIAPQKRPLEALRIVNGLVKEFPSMQLAFVGEGIQREAVVEEATRLGISARVHFVGYQTNVADWLAAATVWLLPTERENFSLGVLEALAAGCPVLSTTCSGNDEVLVDGKNALTFGVGDVSAATIALRRLLRDSTLREKLSANAKMTARLYTPELMVARYEALYSRVACMPTLYASP